MRRLNFASGRLASPTAKTYISESARVTAVTPPAAGFSSRGGVGLDAFAQKPTPPQHPFFGHPQLVLSPHIGGVTCDAYVNMGVAAARNVLRVLGMAVA